VDHLLGEHMLLLGFNVRMVCKFGGHFFELRGTKFRLNQQNEIVMELELEKMNTKWWNNNILKESNHSNCDCDCNYLGMYSLRQS